MKKAAVWTWIQAVLSAGLIPLWFVKIFHDVGHLPSAEDPNKIVAVHFYFSMYDNMRIFPFFIYLSIGLLTASAVATLIGICKPALPRIREVRKSLFWIAVPFFFLMLLCAAFLGLGRGY
ncbi:MAG: hypothetical protein IJD38_02695 [Clostridia bacterium]|nr:hypothetical protein [Clostridia bacterium]